MPTTIVVGGQYGSEGKGKVVNLLAQKSSRPWVVRCGGPNSGHTTRVADKDLILRQVPAGAGRPNSMLLISAGSAIDTAVLRQEVHALGITRDRLIVDPRAVLIEQSDIITEQVNVHAIAGTGSGTGAALMRRMMRGSEVRLAGTSDEIKCLANVTSVAPLLHDALNSGDDVIVEGTQGFGLSLLHGPMFPFVTARDTTASGFASEVGLPPGAIDEVVMVVRTFPIRVGGPSGPLPDEISWAELKRISGAPEEMPEWTSVTKRLRRVARVDWNLLAMASRYNRPSMVALMGVDRLDWRNHSLTRAEMLTSVAIRFIAKVERTTGAPVRWVGTGFGTDEFAEIQKTDVHCGK